MVPETKAERIDGPLEWSRLRPAAVMTAASLIKFGASELWGEVAEGHTHIHVTRRQLAL